MRLAKWGGGSISVCTISGCRPVPTSCPITWPEPLVVMRRGASRGAAVYSITSAKNPQRTEDLRTSGRPGRVVVSSAGSSGDLMKTTLPQATTRELVEREGQPVVQSRPGGGGGREVVAVLRRIPQMRWAAVAEAPRAETLREAGVLRSRTVLLLTGLVLGVGLLAFMVGLFVTRPLERLTEAAARVAAGDLSGEPPPGGEREVRE